MTMTITMMMTITIIITIIIIIIINPRCYSWTFDLVAASNLGCSGPVSRRVLSQFIKGPFVQIANYILLLLMPSSLLIWLINLAEKKRRSSTFNFNMRSNISNRSASFLPGFPNMHSKIYRCHFAYPETWQLETMLS